MLVKGAREKLKNESADSSNKVYFSLVTTFDLQLLSTYTIPLLKTRKDRKDKLDSTYAIASLGAQVTWQTFHHRTIRVVDTFQGCIYITKCGPPHSLSCPFILCARNPF